MGVCVIYIPYQMPAVSAPQRLTNKATRVGTVTRLQASRYEVRIPVEVRDISLLHNVQTGSFET